MSSLTAQIAALAGGDATLVGGGLLGAALTLGTDYVVPRLRADDARSAAQEIRAPRRAAD